MKTWLAAILSLCFLASCDNPEAATKERKERTAQFDQIAKECVILEKERLVKIDEVSNSEFVLGEAKTPGESQLALIRLKEAREARDAATAQSDAAFERLEKFEHGNERLKRALQMWSHNLRTGGPAPKKGEEPREMNLNQILLHFS